MSGPLDSLAGALEHAMQNGAWILAEPGKVDERFAAGLGSCFDDAYVRRRTGKQSLPADELRDRWRSLGFGATGAIPADEPEVERLRDIDDAVDYLLGSLDKDTLYGLSNAESSDRDPIELVKAKLGLWESDARLVLPDKSPDEIAALVLAALHRRLGENEA